MVEILAPGPLRPRNAWGWLLCCDDCPSHEAALCSVAGNLVHNAGNKSMNVFRAVAQDSCVESPGPGRYSIGHLFCIQGPEPPDRCVIIILCADGNLHDFFPDVDEANITQSSGVVADCIEALSSA